MAVLWAALLMMVCTFVNGLRPAAPTCIVRPTGGLVVAWGEHPRQLHEIQVFADAAGAPVAAQATPTSPAIFQHALPGRQYWVRFRVHALGAVSKAGNWSEPSHLVECAPQGGRQEGAGGEHGRRDRGAFSLSVVRQSEYSNEIDYLGNHDSADMRGSANFLTGTATTNANRSIVNVSFYNSTFTRYCVELLPAQLPFKTRSHNSSFFADYLSCNWVPPVTPAAPTCHCQVWADRSIAGDDIGTDACHVLNHPRSNCTWDIDMVHNCSCPCDQAAMMASEAFTGMMPCLMFGKQQGTWYSHPQAAECQAHQPLGSVHPSTGRVCTWKQAPEMRLVHGWQLLRLGFNYSFPDNLPDAEKQAIVEQNTRVMQAAFDEAPLKKQAPC
eukprot:TRINITY_DN18917_c0_g1_i2.p1 TRINITY_DN18917_c0_g1~~TRINITY_DN18917_c0_g1_i2.p1  ORF type:complete len:384 (-),score=79.97 TRINITY_DN18917_c0_g1_i2:118-1269(-)